MFGLKSKLKPRVKPVISKASKSEENKNAVEGPLPSIKDSWPAPTDGSQASTLAESEKSIETGEPDKVVSTVSFQGNEPEQLAPITTMSESDPTRQLVATSKSESSVKLTSTAKPDTNLTEVVPPFPATDSLLPDGRQDCTTLSDSITIEHRAADTMPPPKPPPPKPRLSLIRKPTPVLSVKRKPILLPTVVTIDPPLLEDKVIESPLEPEPEDLTTQPRLLPPKENPKTPATNASDKQLESTKQDAPPHADQEVKNKIGRLHVFKPTLDRQRTPKFTTSTYGKMSSEAKAQMLKKFGTTTPDLSKLTMLDLIFYNPKMNAIPKTTEKPQAEKIKTAESPSNQKNNSQEEQQKDENSDTKNSLNSRPTPKIKLDSNGRAVVDTESIIIRNKAPDEVDTEILEESDRPKKGIKRKRENNFWNYEDTIKFYKALLKYGSDFTMMLSEFPGRDRKSLKSKFKREEKVNGKLIDKVIGTGFQLFDVNSLETELSTAHCPPDPSKKKPTRKSENKSNTTKDGDRALKGKRKRRKASDIINNGPTNKAKKLRRNLSDLADEDSATEDSPPPSSPVSMNDTSIELDNSDDERSSVVSEVAREEFIKEFLQNGKVVFNTSIVSNSLSCSQSIRLDTNRDELLDVNLTVSHSIETNVVANT